MTVLDLEKLQASPPKINPRRKNIKVINSRAMAEFGSEAFNVDLGQMSAQNKQGSNEDLQHQLMTRLNKGSASIDTSMNKTDVNELGDAVGVGRKSGSVSPKHKKPVKTLNHANLAKESSQSALHKKEEWNIKGKKELLQSLNDLGD